MENPFPQVEVDAMYELLTSCDEDLVAMLAKAAIKSALEVRVEMWNNADNEVKSAPLFDDNDVRAAASSFAADMLSDLGVALNSAIAAVRFKGNANKVLDVDLKFAN